MMKNDVLELAAEVMEQGKVGEPIDPHALAMKLLLLCLNGQESQVYQFVAQRDQVWTRDVCDHFGMTPQQAGTILLDMLQMGVVQREFERGSKGRPRSIWTATRYDQPVDRPAGVFQ